MTASDKAVSWPVQRFEGPGYVMQYYGDGQGLPVLLLHGFPDTPATFFPLLQELAADHACLVPFLPGYDGSTLPRHGGAALSAVAEQLADFTKRILGQKALSRGIVVIGHDWGSALAQILWARHLLPIRGLVLMAVPPAGAMRRNINFQQIWRSRYMYLFQLPGVAWWIRRRHFSYIRLLWRRWSPVLPEDHEQLQRTVAVLSQPHCLEQALGYYRTTLNPLLGPKLWWQTIKTMQATPDPIPTLVMYGTADGCIGPDMFRDALKGWEHPLSRVEAIAAGHFFHLERTEETGLEIKRFLDGLE